MSQGFPSETLKPARKPSVKSLNVLSSDQFNVALQQALKQPLAENEVVCVTSPNVNEISNSKFESIFGKASDRDSSLLLGQFHERISVLTRTLTPSQIFEILDSEFCDVNEEAVDIFVFPWTPWSLEFEGLDPTAFGESKSMSRPGLIPIKLKSGMRVNLRSFSKQQPIWKRLFDVGFSAGAILLLSPLFLGTSIAIKLTSRGPIFFRQLREGKDGVPFDILKFRTMVDGAEHEQARLRDQNEVDGPAFKIEADPRLTVIGKWLRLTCVDELPQFINVLMGDMSVVGPRPLPVDESRACSDLQRRRLEVAPGMTCYWQVCNRKNVSFEDWMELDFKYTQKRSLSEDLKLIWRTLLTVIRLGGSG